MVPHQDRDHARFNDVVFRLRLIISLADDGAERSWFLKRSAEHGGSEWKTPTSRMMIYLNDERTNATTFHGVSVNTTAAPGAMRFMVAIDLAASKASFDNVTQARAAAMAAMQAVYPDGETKTFDG